MLNFNAMHVLCVVMVNCTIIVFVACLLCSRDVYLSEYQAPVSTPACCKRNTTLTLLRGLRTKSDKAQLGSKMITSASLKTLAVFVGCKWFMSVPITDFCDFLHTRTQTFVAWQWKQASFLSSWGNRYLLTFGGELWNI